MCPNTVPIHTVGVRRGNAKNGAHLSLVHTINVQGEHKPGCLTAPLVLERVPAVLLPLSVCFSSENQFSSLIVWLFFKSQLFSASLGRQICILVL